MNTNSLQSTARPAPLSSIVVAWVVVLLVSALPDALWQAFAGAMATWLFPAKVGGLFAVILLGSVWKPLYGLRPFFVLLLILAAGGKALSYLGMTASYLERGEPGGWLLRLAQVEGSRLLLTAVMVAALLLMGKRRQDFFIAKGDLRTWMRPGIILALSVMVLTFLFFDYDLPSWPTLMRALPLLPVTLLFGALFAFDEEMRYRATLLPHLYDVVGKNHSIMMTAFYFGMAHFFGGVPSGVEGFFIAGALGWLYATMMLETRGVFMPWLNHVLTNVPTFIFWTIGWVSG
jgi:hypothetical protein